jgi:hypothetical protein
MDERRLRKFFHFTEMTWTPTAADSFQRTKKSGC